MFNGNIQALVLKKEDKNYDLLITKKWIFLRSHFYPNTD